MSNKRKQLLAAFASASMIATTPAVAADFSSGAPAQQAVTATNDNQCYTPPNIEGGRIYRDRSCASLQDFLDDPDDFKETAMYDSLMALYDSSDFGRQMLENAARDGYRICDMELSATVAAVHFNTIQKIGVDYSRQNNLTTYVSHLIHEFAHYYQSSNGVDYYDHRRTLAENQRAMLSMETAAPVTEVIGLFLAGQAGTIDWRQDLHPRSAKYHWLVQFEERYNAEIQIHNNHDQALNEAAKEVWQTVLQNQSKLNFYNESAARYTILYMDNLRPSMSRSRERSVNRTVNNAGRMGPNINFTSVEAMPDTEALFGTSDKMRQLFNAVEWHRQSRIWGADNPQVQRNYNILVERGNEFITADFNDVSCKISQGMSTRDAFNPDVERLQPPVTLVSNTRVKVNFNI